jgi:hypothetical protein
MSDVLTGQCLCGAVRLQGRGRFKIDVCHCGICRRWHGGPATGIAFSDGITAAGMESVRWHRSSDWAERGFCGACGSTLFYRFVEQPEALMGMAGSFDLPADAHIEEEIYIDHKPGWYDFDCDVPCLTEAEVVAKYTASP